MRDSLVAASLGVLSILGVAREHLHGVFHRHIKARARRSVPRDGLMILAEPLRSDPSPDGMISITCTRCESRLDLHMPDMSRPDRLLGICEECGAWFLIEEDSGLIALLPDSLSD